MPILNFKAQFIEPIQTRVKAHTIRATRKIPVKPGDLLYLYTGLRHKGAYRILPEPVVCTRVESITIKDAGQMCTPRFSIHVEGYVLDKYECERLAHADGFDSFGDMMKFWEGRLPFEGQIIHWR
jgi:hypothetical protein